MTVRNVATLPSATMAPAHVAPSSTRVLSASPRGRRRGRGLAGGEQLARLLGCDADARGESLEIVHTDVIGTGAR